MNRLTRIVVDTSTYLLMFLFIQLFCLAPAQLASANMSLTPWTMGLSMLASSVITVAFYWWRKWWKEDKADVTTVSWLVYVLIVFLAISSFLPSMGLLEMLGVEANEQQERIMMDIICSPFGFIVIALLVPLAEEVVFRGSILRALLGYFKTNKKIENAKGLKAKDGVWLSIIISSMLFGTVHGNLAQFIHATLLGILLGWLYTKTKTILPGVFLHLLNNGIAFLLVKIDPSNNDAKLIDMFSGNEVMMWLSVAISIAVLLVCLRMLAVFFKYSSMTEETLERLREEENIDIEQE